MRTVVGGITRHPDTLTEDETTQLKAVFDARPELDQTHELVRDFAQMPVRRTGADQPDWIRAARAARQPGISGFAHGLNTDLEAVIAGLTVHWSSGGTEGAVNRMKKTKRQLYGRSGFQLLRKMISLRCPSETAPQDLCRGCRWLHPGDSNWLRFGDDSWRSGAERWFRRAV
ncbi:transposase [Streptomyces sp. R21]|uniref:Transposase n=1 Tax=Streptomyces sp. R21 TaxID=3238627 RepID=A0AB39P345_9ACTN